MNKQGPILVIDEDREDQEMFKEIFTSLGYENKVIGFFDGMSVLKFLDETKEKPFLIISDVRLPKMNGFELKDKIRQHEATWVNCVPYLFFTSSPSNSSLLNAYAGSSQGFFIKPYTMGELEEIIKNITGYWMACKEPHFTA